MGHSRIRSLVHSHCSILRLLRTARFVCALCCAQSPAPELVGQWIIFVQFSKCFESLCILRFLSAQVSSVTVSKGDDGLLRPIDDYATFLRRDDNVKELIRLRRKEAEDSPKFMQTKLLAKRYVIGATVDGVYDAMVSLCNEIGFLRNVCF